MGGPNLTAPQSLHGMQVFDLAFAHVAIEHPPEPPRGLAERDPSTTGPQSHASDQSHQPPPTGSKVAPVQSGE